MESSNLHDSQSRAIVKPPPTVMVIFGATGDLTGRKLIPALYNLFFDGYLPDQFYVVGAARTVLSDAQFREQLHEPVKKYSRRGADDTVWGQFAERIFYQPTDGTKSESFVALRKRLEAIHGSSEPINYLYYLSVAPAHFGSIAANLAQAGLVADPHDASRRTVLVAEKPFGFDRPSAIALNNEVRASFAENQIFRIDHYLGKETVQNILVMRFANGIFEPIWNRHHIDHIQIAVCEEIGVGNRAPYFDENGISRDIIQNHLLQMLSLLCIEPPLSLNDADSIRTEKVKVLKALRRYTPQEAARASVRAQYNAGTVGGEKVVGYRQEKGVSADSQTETYAAMRLELDTWRWSGVPIYIRAGKRLPRRMTELTVVFRKPPTAMFSAKAVEDLEPNMLTIQVQPNEGISWRINSKPPGLDLSAHGVVMDFAYKDSFSTPSAEAYERLILDAMRGDATLFIRDDEIEEAWDVLAPFFEAWRNPGLAPLYGYESGTWGPTQAAELPRAHGHRWRRL